MLFWHRRCTFPRAALIKSVCVDFVKGIIKDESLFRESLAPIPLHFFTYTDSSQKINNSKKETPSRRCTSLLCSFVARGGRKKNLSTSDGT